MKKKTEARIYAAAGTCLFMLLLFLLLWFVYIAPPYLPEDEGIEVSFGEAAEGGGVAQEPQPQAVMETTAPQPAPQTPTNNDLMTQEDEESLALAKQKKEEEAKRKAEEEELIRQRKAEEERQEAERIAKEKALAEQRAKEQEAINKANKLGQLFGNSTSPTGSGTSTGETTQGNPVGQGVSGGNAWSVNGRTLKGKLSSPAYTGDQEGKIVVAIRVNAQGQVVATSIAQGTTISDKSMQDAACKEARKAVFTAGQGEVSGKITYQYKLK